ncbi:MAG: ethanolamine ammonia-lyase subunit EutC [Alphaproteobacteria bacterium]|nr:ethanolamine ammonia-lyase subunit EutC [Alphaproteobacteria bacterium]
MTDHDDWYALSAFTPARLALGRAGNALPTSRVLEFELAHARARDAVLRPFDSKALATQLDRPGTILLRTQATDRQIYLMNPDTGRTLDDTSRAQLERGAYDAALVIADGLSSTAVDEHGAALARAVLNAMPELEWAPVTVVRGGRVAVGDDVASALGADLAIVLIGERPGLSAADSIGIYLTYAPRPGVTKDADRNCISNVRPGGLPLDAAATRLAWLARQARHLRLTGVGLKEDAPEIPDIATDSSNLSTRSITE